MSYKIFYTLSLALLSGCASHPANIEPAYVSPLKYDDYNCEQIATERQATASRLRSVREKVYARRATDETQVMVGVLLFWPTLLFLGDGPEAAQYAQLKGEYDAMLESSHRCQAPVSGPTLCDAYSLPADHEACLRDGDWKEVGYRRLGTEQ